MLPKGAYEPKQNESEILEFWLSSGFYKPEFESKNELSTASKKNRETFSIVLPPPNANGNLHLGHMSGYAYQDIMARYNRMKGKKVLLLPGKDHAGIQTEVVFEKELEKQGKNKKDIGREEFYKLCYDFCILNSENARNQEKAIGLSADFDRELFTLDPKVVDTILETFIMMYKDGLVYRGKRLINWCPRCQSALADIDTEFKDSKTNFVYFKYGFEEPEPEAIKIKNEYQGKTIEWNFERNKTSDGKNNLPFSFGKNDKNIEIIGIGYENLELNSTQSGKVIGIQMKLDNRFRIVVQNVNFNGDIHEKLGEIFLFEMKYYAGAHIILFDEYKEDKFYNNGFIMGTVRPETKFGDTAIAVDPDDERYSEFVGKKYRVRTLDGIAEIDIIADNAVEEEFGTGAVKITPAHSPEDWDIAARHPEETMPEKQVINFDGKLNHLTGKYEGMHVKEARKAMLPDLKEKGMLIYVDENYENRIRICERCKYPIEPLVSYQWFVDTKPLKAKAKELIENDSTNVMPEGMEKVLLDWLDSPEDWCITRQLWWGYRLPVWYKGELKEYITKTGEVKEKLGDKLLETDEDYKDIMKVELGNPGSEWIQDEDVLDTWFSSGQWPFATLKAREGDYKEFYPTQVMETGWDILIFWVSRMMLLNPYRASKAMPEAGKKIESNDPPKADLGKMITPFHNVYLHGLVLDKNGKKMSKSRGNGIDPFEMMQKYGTDALRFSFVVGNSAGQNYRLYEEKIASYRNFCNKIWNASKFSLMNMEDNFEKLKELTEPDLELHEDDIHMLEHIKKLGEETTTRMDKYYFGIAAQELYESFWHEFADIYLEKIKLRMYTKDKDGNAINQSESEKASRLAAQWTLMKTLDTYLRLLHPFVPFITERIWKELPKSGSESETIMYAEWPTA
ncbi:MAG TPA: class I tRNA ligase family protein [Candidatus Dojkabacteria bacterium]